MKRSSTFFLCAAVFLSSCYHAPRIIEPTLCLPDHPKELFREARKPQTASCDFSTSPFQPLAEAELQSDWGKEMAIGLLFAADFDLYRAITAFKRALYLLPLEATERRLEITYDIALAYYLGKKYVETVYTIEASGLIGVDAEFKAFHDLLLVLYDSYAQIGESAKAGHILSLIEQFDQGSFEKLTLLSALAAADLNTICAIGQRRCDQGYLCDVVTAYHTQAKSVRKAELLNTFFPGAGYWYVGQKSTAVTALLVNALFITAAAECFIHGQTAAGVITLSLETGWYFGGIYGAGLAAKAYNEKLYSTFAEKVISSERNVPLFMLNYSF